jgi:hypothetical protein
MPLTQQGHRIYWYVLVHAQQIVTPMEEYLVPGTFSVAEISDKNLKMNTL